MSVLLLDTDACIEIIRGNPKPLDRFPEYRAVISTVSRFEILSGLRGNGSPQREARAHAFLDVVETFAFNDSAADCAARVRIHLEAQGMPIGAYDLLLAGHALAMGCPLLSGNLREFARVPDLKVVTWREEG